MWFEVTLLFAYAAVGVACVLNAAMKQQKSLCLVVAEAKFVDHHACATVHEFLVGELHVHHLVALHASHLNHDAGRNHVADEFLACSALHAAAASDVFRANNHLDGNLGSLADGGVGVTGDGGGEASMGTGVAQGTNYVGCSSAGGDAYNGVVARDVVLLQVFPPSRKLRLTVLLIT